MTATTRFDHSNCSHAKSGAEGKKARAACRKEHAAKVQEVKKAPKAATPKAATPRPRRKPPVASKTLDLSSVVEPAK